MSDLNLNLYLFPNDSPYVQNQALVSGFEFDYANEAGVITNGKIKSLEASKIAAGTVLVGLNIGSASNGYVKIDGENKTIVVNDGTYDRVLIGYQSSGF